MKQLFGLLVISVAVFACHKPDANQIAGCSELVGISHRDPSHDADIAMSKGDTRLLLIGGFVGTVPGAEGVERPWRMLSGTTDSETRACANLRPDAVRYAAAYNKRMLSISTK